MRLTSLLFFLLYAMFSCVLGEPKRGPPKDEPNRPPSPKTARSVLEIVAQNRYLTYQKHMKQRANIHQQLRDRRKEGPPPTILAEDWRKENKELSSQASKSWETAESAAKANHQVYSVIKNVKKTHRPRYNDFRRWGYSPRSSELTVYTIPSELDTPGSSMAGTRGYRLTAPAKSSRTHSPLTHSRWDDWSPWDHIPQKIQGKERKRAMWYYWGRGSTPSSERQRRLQKSAGSSQSLGGVEDLTESESAEMNHLAKGHQSQKGSKSFGDFDSARSKQLGKHGLSLKGSKSSPGTVLDPFKEHSSSKTVHESKVNNKSAFKAYGNPAFSASSKSSRDSDEHKSPERSKSLYHKYSPQDRENQEWESDRPSSQNRLTKQNFVSPFALHQQQRLPKADLFGSTTIPKQEREREIKSSFGCLGRLCGAVARRGRGKAESRRPGRRKKGNSTWKEKA